jgi:hypothetical protein
MPGFPRFGTLSFSFGVECYRVHYYWGHTTGLLYQPQVMVDVDDWNPWNDWQRKPAWATARPSGALYFKLLPLDGDSFRHPYQQPRNKCYER